APKSKARLRHDGVRQPHRPVYCCSLGVMRQASGFRFGNWNLEFVIYLEFGAWDLEFKSYYFYF
ncbi:MAG: hypothetical protein JXI33_06365, partial [Candidatus Aminicenantes bacterium]|nr:hypothetical protein [Candidatus Aminicenantes bacterium]